MMSRREISLALIIILVANLILFAFRLYNGLVFWIVVILGALMAYLVLPRMKQHGHIENNKSKE